MYIKQDIMHAITFKSFKKIHISNNKINKQSNQYGLDFKNVLVRSKESSVQNVLNIKCEEQYFLTTLMGLMFVEVWFLSRIRVIWSSASLFHDQVVHWPARG